MSEPDAIDERALRKAAAGASAGSIEIGALGAELARRAGEQGLIEIAYRTIDTPLGPVLAAATDLGLVRLGFPGEPGEPLLEGLAGAIGPRIVETPDGFDDLRAELDEYFAGERRNFEVPLDWRLTGGFVRRILRHTAEIPFGQTRTYAEVATAAGSPRAFRAAGSALGANPIPIVVPCHRVLRSGGGLGGYGGGLETKRRLLRIEGVEA